MAISVHKGRHLAIVGDECTGYEMAHVYITTLLNMMQSVTDDDRLSANDVYYMCEMIRLLLPTETEFDSLERIRYPKEFAL